jgi:mRNA interferase RelE/StbE
VGKYSLEIKHSAQKELDALDQTLFTRIDRRILELAAEPRPAGCKKLKGYRDQWRLRVGDWRVVYIVDDVSRLIIILALHTAEKSMNDRKESNYFLSAS